MAPESSGQVSRRPWAGPGALLCIFFGSAGALLANFGQLFLASGRFLAVFGSRLHFFLIFLVFAPLRTPKNHGKHCTVIKNQGSADL